jgi:hypothetical protein
VERRTSYIYFFFGILVLPLALNLAQCINALLTLPIVFAQHCT